MLYATQNSLQSEPCKEEYAYALDRALSARSQQYRVIALFPSSVDKALLPAEIRTRLFLSTTDPDWKERIVAAAEKRAPSFDAKAIQPYQVSLHTAHPSGKQIVELRPRAGVWGPVFAAVPIEEKDACELFIMVEPSNSPTGTGMSACLWDGPSDDGKWWVIARQAQATPTMSLYVWYRKAPSALRFGPADGKSGQYEIKPP